MLEVEIAARNRDTARVLELAQAVRECLEQLASSAARPALAIVKDNRGR